MARARDGSNEVQRLRTHSGAAVAALTVGSPATRVLAPTIPAPRTRNDLRRTKRGSVRHQSERGWRQATAIRSAAGAGVPTSGAGPGDLKSNSGVCEGAFGVARSIDPVFFPNRGVPSRKLFGNPVAVHMPTGVCFDAVSRVHGDEPGVPCASPPMHSVSAMIRSTTARRASRSLAPSSMVSR